jgi:superfamily II DNA or RNA helicase
LITLLNNRKTIQVISLLAALLKKKGCGKDEFQLKKRRKLISRQLHLNRRQHELALRNGNIPELNSHIEGLLIPKWVPILVIVPPSVIENWMNEFEAWGHFGVAAFSGSSKHRALDRVRTGLDEIMVCGKTMLQNDDDLHEIKQIKWKLIIIDEYHQYKNFRTKLYLGLKSLRDTCKAPLVGLTGTLMQNNHEELWSEVDLVNPGFLGSWEEFKDDTSVPIKLGRTKTADDAAVEEGNQVRDWLKTKLKSFYLQRRKIDVLKDDLPEKNERVVFCELSALQKRLYQHLMTLPDFVLVKYGNAPCECGINQAIFQGFKHMRTEKEKIAYQRNHRDDIIPRKSCCHKRPLNFFRFEDGEEFYDPRAPLWRWQHEKLVHGEEEGAAECKGCPYCISFSVLDKLYKLSSHVSLLQLPKHPKDYVEGSRAWKDAQKGLDFAKVAFPDDVLELLPGGSYIREDGIMDDHSNLSGKMKILADLLIEFSRRDDRLLIFSFSTQTLDLIQNFVKAQGYSFLRLDGSTPAKARQGLVDNYQKNKDIFLFLISTKAGGLGLNLTAANVVIVFDVDFNPSNDEQSQDRAYRIGQKRNVLVIRLVSRGTIEELKYIRQLYKLQLKNYTIGSLHGEQSSEDAEAARMFRAVEGDKDRKGELFGMENLLKFKDGSFMDDLWKPTSEGSGLKGLERFGLRSALDMAGRLEAMSEERINEVGGNIVDESFREAVFRTVDDSRLSVDVLLNGEHSKSHGDYLRADRGDALFKRGDQGFDEEMGGYSQAEHYVMENAKVEDTTVPSSSVPNDWTNESIPIPSPVRSFATPAARIESLDTIDESPVLKDRPAPVYHRLAQRHILGLPNESIQPKLKISVTRGGKSPGATLFLGKKSSSVFSAKDLYIPGRKMKKKNRISDGVARIPNSS